MTEPEAPERLSDEEWRQRLTPVPAPVKPGLALKPLPADVTGAPPLAALIPAALDPVRSLELTVRRLPVTPDLFARLPAPLQVYQQQYAPAGPLDLTCRLERTGDGCALTAKLRETTLELGPERSVLRIGRGSENEFVVPDPLASRMHVVKLRRDMKFAPVGQHLGAAADGVDGDLVAAFDGQDGLQRGFEKAPMTGFGARV